MDPTLLEIINWTGSACIAISLVYLWKARLAFWLWSQASVLCFILLFWEYDDRMAAGLQLSYGIMGCYGIYRWWEERRGRELGALGEHLGAGLALLIFALSMLATDWGEGWAYVEASAVGLAVLAIYLTVLKKTLCWPIWIMTNVLFAALFAHQDLWPTFAAQFLLAGMSVYGWLAWHRHGPNGDGDREAGRLRKAKPRPSTPPEVLAHA